MYFQALSPLFCQSFILVVSLNMSLKKQNSSFTTKESLQKSEIAKNVLKKIINMVIFFVKQLMWGHGIQIFLQADISDGTGDF